MRFPSKVNKRIRIKYTAMRLSIANLPESTCSLMKYELCKFIIMNCCQENITRRHRKGRRETEWERDREGVREGGREGERELILKLSFTMLLLGFKAKNLIPQSALVMTPRLELQVSLTERQ